MLRGGLDSGNTADILQTNSEGALTPTMLLCSAHFQAIDAVRQHEQTVKHGLLETTLSVWRGLAANPVGDSSSKLVQFRAMCQAASQLEATNCDIVQTAR